MFTRRTLSAAAAAEPKRDPALGGAGTLADVSDQREPPADDHADRDTVDARPFAVAAVIFVVLAVVALVFLDDDDDLVVVHPDRFERIDDTTVHAVASTYETTGCEVIERVQVGLDDDTVFVEFVVGSTDSCVSVVSDLAATITLPEPLDERRLVGGAGRRELPCARDGSEVAFTCGPDR